MDDLLEEKSKNFSLTKFFILFIFQRFEQHKICLLDGNSLQNETFFRYLV